MQSKALPQESTLPNDSRELPSDRTLSALARNLKSAQLTENIPKAV